VPGYNGRFAAEAREGAFDDHATEMIGVSHGARALAVLRVVLGAMFVWVLRTRAKARTPGGVQGSHRLLREERTSPAVWKGLISVAAPTRARRAAAG
jgi:hypothetical protein